MWLRFFIEDQVGVAIIDIIPHCHTENAFKRDKNQEMWLRFYIEDKGGVSIIDIIPHCHSENVLKRGKNQEIRLRFYMEEKMEHLSSIIFHTVLMKCFKREQIQEMCLRCYTGNLNFNVWYNIVDRYLYTRYSIFSL